MSREGRSDVPAVRFRLCLDASATNRRGKRRLDRLTDSGRIHTCRRSRSRIFYGHTDRQKICRGLNARESTQHNVPDPIWCEIRHYRHESRLPCLLSGCGRMSRQCNTPVPVTVIRQRNATQHQQHQQQQPRAFLSSSQDYLTQLWKMLRNRRTNQNKGVCVHFPQYSKPNRQPWSSEFQRSSVQGGGGRLTASFFSSSDVRSTFSTG